MSWTLCPVTAGDIEEMDGVLRAWEPVGGVAAGFQSGDLGWELREGAVQLAARLRCWRDDAGNVGALGIMEGPAALWLSIDPARLMDLELAEAIAHHAMTAHLTSVSPPATPAVVRASLGRRGYSAAPDPWLFFWKPLTDADMIDVPGVFATSTPLLRAERIRVQQLASDDHAFGMEQWQRIASGPAFRPELDLMAVNDAGEGVSALTAWLPGPRKCGIIKAVGTHPAFRRQGHARRVLQASFAALRRLGASGVHLFADRDNPAAIATYQAVGFQVLGHDTEMVQPDRQEFSLP